TNIGDAATSSSWVDRVYLSANGQLAGATLLASVTRPADLAPGAHYDQVAQATLPNLPGGDYHILIVADAAGNVTEPNEVNNLSAAPNLLTVGHPDLVADSVTVSPTPGVFGQNVTVGWTVRNLGAAAFASWSDSVYLSSDATISGDDRLLGTFPSG